MYKDLNHEDAEHVEKKLANLEGQSSKVIRDIIEASKGKSDVMLLRKDLQDLRKFLFIMNYRKLHRRNQFANKIFDPPTLNMVENFMKERNLQSTREVWLQNVREILETPHEDVPDNPRIFSLDRSDYKTRMIDCFLAIWQAGENDDFRKEIGLDAVRTVIGPGRHSIFEYVPHPPATPEYVNNVFDDSFKTQLDDKFTFHFVKINSATVHLVNAFILNEANPDLVLSYLSPSYLYKTIVKYHKSINKLGEIQDFSSMKKTLFTALNKTHKEDLSLRKSIPRGRTRIWHEFKMVTVTES
ncbi:11955_t:CDS:2 [Diversispora eburnea]|uniref:11955_t:CDS:1 n=1 Tax=Diversispora eburnea TaxID=1213867 RepID=A0A9N8VJW9_9GLOM|nr:11955_t:CDS:2 [Diversispora eburnea]